MTRRAYRLYWSSLELYEDCPQKFLWYRGWGTLDLGAGAGNPKPLTNKDRKSEHHLLMGIVLANAFENIYNKEWWRKPKQLKDKLEHYINEEFDIRLTKFYIDWDHSPPKSELLDLCQKGALGYLMIMKQNRLLGDIYSKSEVWLKSEVDNVPIGGRPDLILKSSRTGVSIIDGKNSKTPGRYTKKDQLRWYALLYYLIYGELASDLAFAYFRYPPTNPPESHLKKKRKTDWTGLVHVDVNMSHLEDLSERAKNVYRGMMSENFEAKPSSKSCRFCEHKRSCTPYLEFQASKSNTEFSGKGYVDLSF